MITISNLTVEGWLTVALIFAIIANVLLTLRRQETRYEEVDRPPDPVDLCNMRSGEDYLFSQMSKHGAYAPDKTTYQWFTKGRKHYVHKISNGRGYFFWFDDPYPPEMIQRYIEEIE